MALKNTRYQHPVGQGFFHTADLCEDNELRLSYVYDCGAMTRYASDRSRQINEYLKLVGAGSILDILFISHLHADHVNGIEQLLHRKQGLKVDTIILPLVNVGDRLIAFARSVKVDPGSAGSRFYRDFIVNPSEALRRFSPRQIIFVQPGDRKRSAPEDAELPLLPRDEVKVSGLPRGENGPKWKLVGQGAISIGEALHKQRANGTNSPTILIMDDTVAMLSRSRVCDWLLATFVDPTVKKQCSTFLNALANQRKMSRSALEIWLRDQNNIRVLVTTDRDQLVSAYGQVVDDLNITSLCLYSGPSHAYNSNLPRVLYQQFGAAMMSNSSGDQSIGWLATGDAALKVRRCRTAFVDHYGNLLKDVATLTLPHHGSDNNFHIELLAKVRPTLCVAAADCYSSWKHPGSHTVQAVYSQPALLQVVTSSVYSSVFERATLG